jgi:3-keto-L-gulonate-6-phosphate decarboxylase
MAKRAPARARVLEIGAILADLEGMKILERRY